ncbi:MAG: Mur ligase family protein [Candidatus Saccharimonadales bacterium]
MFKLLIQKILEHYAKKYLKKHDIKLVAVVGSVGKTTTKLAIATILGEHYRVRTHEGNYNTELAAPVAILGITYPDNIKSLTAWMNVFKAAKLRISNPKDTDVIVQELGTDKPGDIPAFGRYLCPDITVITSVGLEHMEYFKTLDAVAQEELSAAKFSKLTIVNRDDIDPSYAKYADTKQIATYGSSDKAEYHIDAETSSVLDGGVMGTFYSPEWPELSVNLQLVGTHSVKAAAAAGAVAAKLGLSAQQVAIGMAKIRAVKGRMNILRGVNGSTIIDDSYNASPMAVEAALSTLYMIDAPQRVAVLGSMNEFGELSQTAHESVGALCDPNKLDFVVTVGEDAKNYLAVAAKKKGCQVKSFDSPYDAGGFVHSVVKPGCVVLVKGSQNRIFTEEATKVLLHDAQDESQLVRQSPEWMEKKRNQFTKSIINNEEV